jgi:hypothetical protein
MVETEGLLNYLRPAVASAARAGCLDERALSSGEALEPARVRVRNGRGLHARRGEAALDGALLDGPVGFALVEQRSAASDPSAPEQFDLLREELGALGRRLSGAPLAFVSAPYVRDESGDAGDMRRHTKATRAHHIVHNDYSSRYLELLQSLAETRSLRVGPAQQQQVEQVEQEQPAPAPAQPQARSRRSAILSGMLQVPPGAALGDAARALRGARRVVVLNMWQSALPRGVPLQHCPLAVCSSGSVAARDIVVRPLLEYAGFPLWGLAVPFEVCLATRSEEHQWHFFTPVLITSCSSRPTDRLYSISNSKQCFIPQ